MTRTLAAVVAIASVAGAGPLGVAQAAPVDVVPVHGSGNACKVRPPHVISAGGAPLAPLRLDLTGVAHRSRSVSEVEQFARRVRTIDGAWHPNLTIRKVAERLTGGSIAGGQVGIVAKLRVSFPQTRTSAAAKGTSYTFSGHTDALSGGLLGGARGNDRLPVEPLGVGARWSIVTCDAVDDVPAKETRTYTLRSVAHGLIVMTFRDVVSMDPRHRVAGSQKLGTTVVRFRLDSLHGTAVGTDRIPIADGMAVAAKVVTRVRFSFHAVSPNLPRTPVVTELVDTRTDTPAV